jgi:hypothetical protein
MDILYKLDSLNIPYLHNHSSAVILAARAALEAAGIAYLPVRVGRAGGQVKKLPAIPSWKEFKQRPPNEAEVRSWIDADLFSSGIAALLTSYTRLIAVDLDRPECIDAFAAAFPDLPMTYIERTPRGGLHFLYRLPAGAPYPKKLQSQRGELLADQYVVIAPTPGYGVLCGNVGAIAALDDQQYARLCAFFANAPERPHSPADGRSHAPPPQIASEAVLRAFWRIARETGSRNQGLFRALTAARDGGMSMDEARALLLKPFIGAPHVGGIVEPDRARAEEFERTLRSAYSRPARRSDASASEGLPNAARELLLQSDPALVKFIDAYLNAGLGGQSVTAKALAAALQTYSASMVEKLLKRFNVVSRIFVINAPLTTHVVSPRQRQGVQRLRKFPADPIHDCARSDDDDPEKASAPVAQATLMQGIEGRSGYENQQQRGPGRPPVLHYLPTASEWCAWLGVRADRPGDPLEAGAFASVRAYRTAVHRALVARRPGRYTREFLARRLGVSRWTLRRYNRLAGVAATPQFERQPLTAALAEALPEDGVQVTEGWWIEFDGRRIAPTRERAAALLAAGVKADLVRQTASSYALSE